MPRRSRRLRVVSFALELGGIAALLGGIAYLSWIVALLALGLVLIVAAQFTEKLL